MRRDRYGISAIVSVVFFIFACRYLPLFPFPHSIAQESGHYPDRLRESGNERMNLGFGARAEVQQKLKC